jgi:hypothetical protein
MGRAGSTLVANAIRNCALSDIVFFDKFEELSELATGVSYKTHDFPPDSLPDNVKVLYLFGDPYDSVISADRKINEWGRAHHKHLGSDLFEPNRSLFYKDTLLLEKNFDLWMRSHLFPFASIRYESLYLPETLDFLVEFLELPIVLPAYRKRMSNSEDHPEIEQLRKVYGRLRAKVDAAEPFRLWDRA